MHSAIDENLQEFRLQHVEEFLDEKKYTLLQSIWAPAFENSKFYLYDDFIKEFLSNSFARSWYYDFIKRIIDTHYTRDVDYEIIDFDHPLVQAHVDFVHSLDRTAARISKIGGKRYITVSAPCMKQLLARSKKPEARYVLELIDRINKFKTEIEHRKNMRVMLAKNTVDPDIIPFLEHFDLRNPPTAFTVAKIAKFDEQQMKWLEYFWQPAFNKTMIYLNDTLIKENLTNDTSNSWLVNFLTRNLEINYEKGVDFMYVPYEHEIVQNYIEMMKSSLDMNFKISRGGGKKYPIVTGECLKLLLMAARTQSGKEVRSTFIKIENLVHIYRKCHEYVMHRYTVDLLTKRAITAESNVKITVMRDELRARRLVEDEESSTFRTILSSEVDVRQQLQQRLDLEAETLKRNREECVKKLKKTEEFIYIMTSDVYQDHRLYKVGHTDNLEKRLRDYANSPGTSRSLASGEKYFVYMRQTIHAQAVERLIKEQFANYKEPFGTNSEIFEISYQDLHAYVDNIITAVNGIILEADKIIKSNVTLRPVVTRQPSVYRIARALNQLPAIEDTVSLILKVSEVNNTIKIKGSDLYDGLKRLSNAATKSYVKSEEVQSVVKRSFDLANEHRPVSTRLVYIHSK